MPTVRQPAVAGRFYPERASVLSRELDTLLEAARPAGVAPGGPLKAMIVPHAGFSYSGPTAARGYALLEPVRDRIRRVVLIGPAHYIAFHGLALSGADTFATPLGEVALDGNLRDALTAAHRARVLEAPHGPEHSLEVQLPFLQWVLDEFELLPVLVGDAGTEEVAEVVRACWGGPETLVLISSDLCHYLPYAQAQAMDADTLRRILALAEPLPRPSACGARGIDGLLRVARERRLRPHVIDHRTSGDTAGDRAAVVGYAAISFTEEIEVASDEHQAE